MRTVTAKMQLVRRISANIGAGSQLALDIGIKITADTSPKYTGEYDVRPKTYEPVVLETKGQQAVKRLIFCQKLNFQHTRIKSTMAIIVAHITQQR